MTKPENMLRVAQRKAEAKASAKQATAMLLAAAVKAAKVAAKDATYVWVIGIDPGPIKSGLASIGIRRDRSLEYFASEHSDTIGAVERIRNAHQCTSSLSQGGALIIALETPQWTPRLPFAAALVETARVEGELAAAFEAMQCRPPIRLRAIDWKRHIGLKPNANDAAVKAALPRMVSGIPRTNCHERDALGLAVAAARLMGLGYRMVDAKEKTT